MPANIWFIVTLLIVFVLGLAALYLFRKPKKSRPIVNPEKSEPPEERITRQKQWEDNGNAPQPLRKRTIEEIKQEILRAQDVED